MAADIAHLVASVLLTGLTSPFTWATVLLAAVLVVACEAADRHRED